MTRTGHSYPRRYVLESTVIALIILGPAVCLGIALDAKGGSIAEWVAALATTGALLAAGYAALSARDLLAVEQARDARNEDFLRRQQASKVALWGPRHEWVRGQTSTDLPDGTKEWREGGPSIFKSVRFRVRNASDLPIFDAVVVGLVSLTNKQNGEVRSSRLTEHLGDIDASVASAGEESGESHTAYVASELVGFDLIHTSVDLTLQLYFRNSFGSLWCRNLDGTLKEAANDHSPRD